MDSCKSPQASLWLYPLLVPSWLLMRILIFNALTLWHTTLRIQMTSHASRQWTWDYSGIYNTILQLSHQMTTTLWSCYIRETKRLYLSAQNTNGYITFMLPKMLTLWIVWPQGWDSYWLQFFYTVRLYISPGAYSGHDGYYYNFQCIFTQ